MSTKLVGRLYCRLFKPHYILLHFILLLVGLSIALSSVVIGLDHLVLPQPHSRHGGASPKCEAVLSVRRRHQEAQVRALRGAVLLRLQVLLQENGDQGM